MMTMMTTTMMMMMMKMMRIIIITNTITLSSAKLLAPSTTFPPHNISGFIEETVEKKILQIKWLRELLFLVNVHMGGTVMILFSFSWIHATSRNRHSAE